MSDKVREAALAVVAHQALSDGALFDAIDALRAALAESEWIPVAERLPEDDSEVLATYDGCIDFARCYDNGHNWRETCEYCQIYPTHWQPLPEPPADYRSAKGILPYSGENSEDIIARSRGR